MLHVMPDVTQLLDAAAAGDPKAAAELLPLVYDELRKLAAARMGEERPGQTLQPTALVHEAYLRLTGDQKFDGCGHFFAAAAEAMRRILVERARGKGRLKRGGDRRRVDLGEHDAPARTSSRVWSDEILALGGALARLAGEDPAAAQVVRLHFFAGLSIDQAADVLGISRATAYRQWTYARAWLRCAIGEDAANSFSNLIGTGGSGGLGNTSRGARVYPKSSRRFARRAIPGALSVSKETTRAPSVTHRVRLAPRVSPVETLGLSRRDRHAG
jgi:RNA polymerase sigma factor (TIGR02999 family)